MSRLLFQCYIHDIQCTLISVGVRSRAILDSRGECIDPMADRLLHGARSVDREYVADRKKIYITLGRFSSWRLSGTRGIGRDQLL